jgi:predicted nuclease with RNAse H fold
LSGQATNADIVTLARDAGKVGIDCPLGWPTQFVDFVVRHQAGLIGAGEAANIDARRELAYRRTDLVANPAGGPLPLSVSTDRIGRAAMRAAGLLATLAGSGEALDRSGRGKVVEVYPAAALRRWGYSPRNYKGRGKTEALSSMAQRFFDETADWLRVDDDQRLQCAASDDAFDAVIAALNARAATIEGAVSTPSAAERPFAVTEGWIAVPTCELAALDPRR